MKIKKGKVELQRWTSKVEKAKKGYKWAVYDKGINVAGEFTSTKKIAEQQAGGWVDYYKKTVQEAPTDVTDGKVELSPELEAQRQEALEIARKNAREFLAPTELKNRLSQKLPESEDRKMKAYEILYITTHAQTYHVDAENEPDALKHIQDEFGKEGERIRIAGMDNIIDSEYQCEGEAE